MKLAKPDPTDLIELATNVWVDPHVVQWIAVPKTDPRAVSIGLPNGNTMRITLDDDVDVPAAAKRGMEAINAARAAR